MRFDLATADALAVVRAKPSGPAPGVALARSREAPILRFGPKDAA